MNENVLKIDGRTLYLRPIKLSDVSDRYVSWLNDPQVNAFLESRFSTQNFESVNDFVQAMIDSPTDILFAICEKATDEHIGNIRLGPINSQHKTAEIGILIGEKKCWGKGYGSEAIGLLKKYAFETLNLHKLTSGAYSANKSSIKAFEKNGFNIEGILKEHCLYDGEFIDDVKMGLINKDYNYE